MPASKLDALTANAGPAATDLVYVEVTPGGTPADRKVAIADLHKATEVTTPDLVLTGLTGSTATGRVVGFNSGPPTTGAHNAGDFVFDTNGGGWMCTTAGTPGLWAPMAGTELDHSEVAASTTFSITSTTLADIPTSGGTSPPAITISNPTRPAMIHAHLYSLSMATAGRALVARVTKADGTLVSNVQRTMKAAANGDNVGSMDLWVRLATGAAAATGYKIQANVNGGADTISLTGVFLRAVLL